MKRLLASIFMLASAIAAHSQGLVYFTARTQSHFGVVNAPIYGPQVDDPFAHLNGQHATNLNPFSTSPVHIYTGPLLVGTGFTAALFGGPVISGFFDLLATTTFRTQASLPGYIVPLPVTVPGVPQGAFATFEVRAWDNRNGTIVDWAAVMADPTIARGQSGPFTPSRVLGGMTVYPPNTEGFTSFNIAPVPEPGVLALGVLGLGAFLLRRRN